MSGLFGLNDPRDQLNDMARAPAAIVPVTPGERAAAEWADVGARVDSLATQSAWHDGWQRVLDSYEKDTGERLPNPWASDPRDREKVIASVNKRLDKARGEGRYYSTEEDLAGQIAYDLQASRDRVMQARSAPQTFASEVAGFAAAGARGALDPVNLLLLPLGAVGATSVLRGALVEAAIATGAQGVIETGAYLRGREFGVEYTAGEAAFNIAAGATASAGLYAGGRGIAALARRTFPQWFDAPERAPAEIRDAIRVTQADEAFARDVRSPVEAAALRRATERVLAGEAVDVDLGPVRRVQALAAAQRLGRDADGQPVDESARFLPGKPVTDADLDRLQVEQDRAVYADVLNAVRYLREEGRRVEQEKPYDLTTFVQRQGGLIEADDTRGELAHMGLTPQARPGLVNNARGMHPDDMARHAWESGYLRDRPNADTRPTVSEFWDALREDFAGRRKSYPSGSEGWERMRERVAKVDEQLEEIGLVWRDQVDDSIVSQLRELLPRQGEAAEDAISAFGRQIEAPEVSRETPGGAQARDLAAATRDDLKLQETGASAARAAERIEVDRLQGAPADMRIPVAIGEDVEGRTIYREVTIAEARAEAMQRKRDAEAITECIIGSVL